MASSGPAAGFSLHSFLSDDHRLIEEVLVRLVDALKADDRDEVMRLWAEFDARLTAHITTEQRHLFPPLLRVADRDARVLIEEHRHIRTRLVQLGMEIDQHVVRIESLRAFIDELRAHSANEERILYRWADAHLDAETHQNMAVHLANTLASLVKTGAK